MKPASGAMTAGLVLLVSLAAAATGIVATVSVAPALTGVVVDAAAQRAFAVTYSSPGRIVAIDTLSHEVVASAELPVGSLYLDVNPGTGRVYAQAPSRVQVYDEATLALVGILPYSDQIGIAVDSAANIIYMVDSFGTVKKIDGSTHALLQSASVGGCADGIAVNSVTGRLYVAAYCAGRLTAVDAGSLAVVAAVPMSTPYRLAVNELTDRVYVSNIEASTVSVVDGATNGVTAVIGVGPRPVSVAVDEVNNRIWVANYGGTTVSIIDGASNSVSETVVVGGSPWGVAIDAATSRAWVASYAAGTVSVLDASTVEPPPPDTAPPVLTVPGDIATEATSGAGAVVTFTAMAVDDVDGEVTPECSPASGSMFGPGTTTVMCTATDAAGNQAEGSFNVRVVVTVDTLEALIRAWVDNAGVANSLIVKLRHGSHGAFRNEVRAQSGKRLTPAQAAELLALVAYL